MASWSFWLIFTSPHRPFSSIFNVYVPAFVVQQHFSHDTIVAIVGNDIDDHAVFVIGKNIPALLEKITNKPLLVKFSVNTIILDKVAAPFLFSSEEFVAQIFVPFEKFFDNSLTQ